MNCVKCNKRVERSAHVACRRCLEALYKAAHPMLIVRLTSDGEPDYFMTLQSAVRSES